MKVLVFVSLLVFKLGAWTVNRIRTFQRPNHAASLIFASL